MRCMLACVPAYNYLETFVVLQAIICYKQLMISQCQKNKKNSRPVSTLLLQILGKIVVLKKSSPEEVIIVINVQFIYGSLLS